MRKNIHKIITNEWGELEFFRIIPTRENGSWGDYHFLKGTVWEQFILRVDGDTFSHALHGYTRPLVEKLGTPFPDKLKRLSKEDGWCKLREGKDCISASPKCYPHKDTPDCYVPSQFDFLKGEGLAEMLLIWKKGGFVVRIVGKEFTI